MILMCELEQIANLADEVYQIDEAGQVSLRPDLGLASLAWHEGQAIKPPEPESLDSLEVTENISTGNKVSQIAAKLQAPLDAVERQTAKEMLGDKTVYKTYIKAMGLLHSAIFLIGAISWSVTFKFSGK